MIGNNSPSRNNNLNEYTEELYFCAKDGHQGNQLNIVCKYEQCTLQGVICASCLLKDHNDHFQYCVPLNDILSITSGAFIPSQQIYNAKTKQVKNVKQLQQQTNLLYRDLARENEDLLAYLRNYREKLNLAIQEYQDICLMKAKQIEGIIKLRDANIFVTEKQINSREEFIQNVQILSSIVELRNQKLEITAEFQHTMIGNVEFLRQKQDFMSQLYQSISGQVYDVIDRNIKEAQREIRVSPSRFQTLVYADNWTVSPAKQDAISFTHLCEEKINLCGVVLHQPSFWPEGRDTIDIIITMYETDQDVYQEKFSQTILISATKTVFDNCTFAVFFSQAIPLSNKIIYTLSISSSVTFSSFSGTNGVNEIDVFYFQNCRLSTNGTDNQIGLIPSLIYF